MDVYVHILYVTGKKPIMTSKQKNREAQVVFTLTHKNPTTKTPKEVISGLFFLPLLSWKSHFQFRIIMVLRLYFTCCFLIDYMVAV